MMRVLRNILRFAPAAAVLALAAIQPARGNDVMYIGDGSDNSLKVFDVITGPGQATASFKGTLVKSQAGLHGPRGLVIAGGNLLVSDQNVGTATNGDILLYDSATGNLLNRVVSHDDPNAPTVPRGIVTWSTRLRTDIFVADFSAESQQNQPPTPGRVRAYTAAGAFIGDLTPDPKKFSLDSYHPRAVVIGPDGLLYVSNAPNGSAGVGGDVLRFSPRSGEFKDVFISDAGGVGHLNRPEGICFGPDGNLYLTSFRADATDNDTVRIYQGPGGTNPGASAMLCLGIVGDSGGRAGRH
jgi:hypothetical protein